MPNDNFTELDQLFRSVLEGADERVPSGVWDSLCDKLDALLPTIAGAAGAVSGALSSSTGAAASGTATSSGAAGASGTAAASGAAASGTAASSGAAGAAAAATASHTVGAIVGAVAAVGVGVTSVAVLHNSNKHHIEEPAPVTEILAEPLSEDTLPADTVDLSDFIRKVYAPFVATVPENICQEEPVPVQVQEPAPQQAEPEIIEPEAKPEPRAEVPWEIPAEPAPKRKISLDIHSGTEFAGVASGNPASVLLRAYEARTMKKTVLEEGESSCKLPLSFGVGILIPVTDRWSFSTGVDYTKLERTFHGRYLVDGDSDWISSDLRNEQHYIGIPVGFYYHFVNSGRLKIYGYESQIFEKCLRDKYSASSETHGTASFRNDVKEWQVSVKLGAGIQYQVAPHLGVYVSPGVRYYLDSNQPSSIRTKEPVRFSAEGGLRFTF